MALQSVARTSQTTRAHSQVVKYRRFVTTRAQDNANFVRYSHKFDRGVICVYCEYSPLHLSPVSGSFIIGVSQSINIHCI